MDNKKKIINIGIVIAIFVILIPIMILMLKLVFPKYYSEYVYKYSQENNIDPLLTFAIIKAESNFDKNAYSSSGAIGLMQLMPATADEMMQELGLDPIENEELYNEENNIRVGTKYYALLLKRYDGKVELALAAYNAGIGNVDKWIEDGIISEDGSNIENIPYKETNNYVRKILRDYSTYKVLYHE